MSSDCTSRKVVLNDGCSSALHGITRGCISNFRRGDCAPDKLVVGSVRFAIIVVPRRSPQDGEEILDGESEEIIMPCRSEPG